MIILNDLHVESRRISGTTISSAEALKQFTLDNLRDFLNTVNEDVLIAGDLFDSFSIPNSGLLATYRIFDRWLEKGHKLYAMRGNHDASKSTAVISSFDLLGALLEGRATFINEPTMLEGGIYCLPHAVNQDIMNLWVENVPECTYCVVHANYHNHWAAESDHSLNISEEQAKAIPVKKLVFAHEHAPRKELAGKVFVMGIQFPTSVSDCLSKIDLHAHRLHTDGTIEPIKTWDKSNYEELDWRDPVVTDAQFIRFVGHCTPAEAADMANVIARYRKTSDAFVVSNAVRVGNDDEGDALNLDSLEAISKFNVMEALKDFLGAEDVAIIEKLA